MSKGRIFVSHASLDRKVADTLCAALECRGVPCWIASRDVEPGESFQDAIANAIEGAPAMVLVFSDNCNRSQEIRKEVALAGQHSVPIIPVRIEDVLPSGGFKYELATRQWIDLFQGWEDAVDRIVGRLRAIVGGPVPPPTPPRSPRRARWLLAGAVIALLVPAALGSAYLDGLFGPGDTPAHYPETAETRRMEFSFTTPASEEVPGKRHWTRVTPDRWIEEYPDGTRKVFSVVGRTHVGECDGTIVSPPQDSRFQLFIPDRDCQYPQLLFRRTQQGRDWIGYVNIAEGD